jgi:CelD/BcsL family acetyltransferase involved in cellulose biosynthesis
MSGQLRKLGNLEFVCLQAADDILPELETLFRLHIARRATTAAPSQFLNPVQRAFYLEMARALAGAGWLRFWALRLDGVAIAVLLGFEFGPRYIGYKPAFDLDYARYSPGRLLLKLVLEQAVERGLEEFDFTVGREPYKREFANHSRTTHRLQVFPSLPSYSVRVGKRYAKRVLHRCALPLLQRLVSRNLLDPWWTWRGDRAG